MSNAISWFADIGLADRPTVGGKGGSLGELTKAGIEVPPGFVVRTEAFEAFVRHLDATEPLRAPVEALDPDDLDAAQALLEKVRARLTGSELPDDVQAEIMSAYEQLCAGRGDIPVAVRSSATTEDAEDASFAGLQDTYLWVIGAESVIDYVRQCWASLYSVESVVYRRKQDFPEAGVAMGVVVQQMVDARCAGVMFTRSPTTGDKSVITVEGAWGLGSAVVSGEVTPDRWVIGKLTGDISVRDISDKHAEQLPKAGGGIEELPVPDERRKIACMSDDELQDLRAIGRKCEKHYGKAQDIEWAVERGTGKILLLQSRPETVWSVKDAEAASVAVVAENPLTHVMNIFGGRR